MLFAKKVRNIISPKHRFFAQAERGAYDFMPDEEYIRLRYKKFFGKEPDLENPRTLCEKLNWLKLYYRRPEYTSMADKYAVKKLVADKIGSEYVIPLLGVYDSFDEIDFDALPDKFVLKCTHDSGGRAICRDKKSFDREAARKTLTEALQKDFFMIAREWPYKNIPRRIIAEEYIDSLGRPDSIEYKITCFNGHVKLITICGGIAHERLWQRSNDHYSRDMKRLNFWTYYKNPKTPQKIPPQMDELIALSEKLGEGVPYLRVDWYIHEGQIYFGEFTFYTWGGLMKFNPPEWDEILGSWLELPEKY